MRDPSLREATGSAKTVLVLEDGPRTAAVVSSILARVSRDLGDSSFNVIGPVHFDSVALDHIRTVVVPLATRIGARLMLPCSPLAIGITNVAAASTIDVGVTVSGYSADLPLFLGIISAITGIPIRPGLLATGHIASLSGAVRPVKNMRAKVEAAVDSPDVDTFVFPDPSADASGNVLSPREQTDVKEALHSASNRIQLIPVKDVTEAMEAVFSEERIVLAGIRHGYFLRAEHGIEEGSTEDDGPLRVLCAELEDRYWSALEKSLFTGDNLTASQLIAERVFLHARVKAYPTEFGARLFRLLQSIPAATRRQSLTFPLVPPHVMVPLIHLAAAHDVKDTRSFLDAVAGDRFGAIPFHQEEVVPPEGPGRDDSSLDLLLARIGAEELAHKVGLPIDAARASYVLDTVIVQDKEGCQDAINSFYVHLLRHTYSVLEPASPRNVSGEAFELLGRAFSRMGGVDAALAEAKIGVRGGLRFCLDRMTDQFRAEEQQKAIRLAFREMWHSLEYDDQVVMMRGLIKRLGSDLPAEVLESPPERYVEQGEAIFAAFVQSQEEVKRILRQL